MKFSIPDQEFSIFIRDELVDSSELPPEESNFEFKSVIVKGNWTLNFAGEIMKGKEVH